MEQNWNEKLLEGELQDWSDTTEGRATSRGTLCHDNPSIPSWKGGPAALLIEEHVHILLALIGLSETNHNQLSGMIS